MTTTRVIDNTDHFLHNNYIQVIPDATTPHTISNNISNSNNNNPCINTSQNLHNTGNLCSPAPSQYLNFQHMNGNLMSSPHLHHLQQYIQQQQQQQQQQHNHHIQQQQLQQQQQQQQHYLQQHHHPLSQYEQLHYLQQYNHLQQLQRFHQQFNHIPQVIDIDSEL